MRGKVCGELSVSYFSEQHCSFHVHVGPTQQMKTPPKSSLFQGPAKWSASRGPAPAKASSLHIPSSQSAAHEQIMQIWTLPCSMATLALCPV